MGKMFLSLGFWMTVVLFIALGFAFDSARGAECSNCGVRQPTYGVSVVPNEPRHFENDLGPNDVARGSKCAPNTAVRSNQPEFEQMANLQQGGPSYAPGLSFTITRRPPEVSLCPGPIQIPRH